MALEKAYYHRASNPAHEMFIIRSQARLVFGHLKLKDGERIYYDQFYDTGLTVCRVMGWSWAEWCETPLSVANRLIERLNEAEKTRG